MSSIGHSTQSYGWGGSIVTGTAVVNKYRNFVLLLIFVVLLREAHLGLLEITNIGKNYQRVKQSAFSDFVSNAASGHGGADTIECIECTIVRDACTRKLLDSSQDPVPSGSFRRMSGRRETSAAFRLLFAAVLAFCTAATAFLRSFRRFYLPCPVGKLFVILDYIHKLDGKK